MIISEDSFSFFLILSRLFDLEADDDVDDEDEDEDDDDWEDELDETDEDEDWDDCDDANDCSVNWFELAWVELVCAVVCICCDVDSFDSFVDFLFSFTASALLWAANILELLLTLKINLEKFFRFERISIEKYHKKIWSY